MDTGKIYLLDLTSLITIISDVCLDTNIAIRFSDIEKWKEVNHNMYEHIIDEINNPVFAKLKTILDSGKLVTIQSAWDKFQDMIEKYGSSQEIIRLNQLKKNINIIKDDPSDEFINFDGNKRIWNELNILIFGTCYKMRYTIVTGNINALYDLQKKNYNIDYIAHRSRCFVGKKYEIKN
jgi:hypothetical protein